MGIATKEATRAAAIMDERAPDGELSSSRASTHASSSWDALCTQGKRQRAVRGAHQHGTALCVLSFLLPRCPMCTRCVLVAVGPLACLSRTARGNGSRRQN
jgi:hypothetical protein